MSTSSNIERDSSDYPPQLEVDKALRFNSGKPKWSYVHFKSLEPLVRVMEYGAEKYAPRNWQKHMELKEIMDSMIRHVAALVDGEEIDPESGVSHIGHIMANAMFYEFHKNKKENE